VVVGGASSVVEGDVVVSAGLEDSEDVEIVVIMLLEEEVVLTVVDVVEVFEDDAAVTLIATLRLELG
jgi:hypothetical protein